jgi:hypothetical protein
MKRWVNVRTGEQERHHTDESIFGKASAAAVREAGITKHATSHTATLTSAGAPGLSADTIPGGKRIEAVHGRGHGTSR